MSKSVPIITFIDLCREESGRLRFSPAARPAWTKTNLCSVLQTSILSRSMNATEDWKRTEAGQSHTLLKKIVFKKSTRRGSPNTPHFIFHLSCQGAISSTQGCLIWDITLTSAGSLAPLTGPTAPPLGGWIIQHHEVVDALAGTKHLWGSVGWFHVWLWCVHWLISSLSLSSSCSECCLKNKRHLWSFYFFLHFNILDAFQLDVLKACWTPSECVLTLEIMQSKGWI